MRRAGKKKNYFPQINNPSGSSNPRKTKAHPGHTAECTIQFPQVSGASKTKLDSHHVPQNLGESSRGSRFPSLVEAACGGRRCVEEQRCSQSVLPSLVKEPGRKSRKVSVKVPHTPTAPPPISGQAGAKRRDRAKGLVEPKAQQKQPGKPPKLPALQQKRSKPGATGRVLHAPVFENSEQRAASGKHLAVSEKLEDKDSQGTSEDMSKTSSFPTRANAGEVIYHDLDSLTAAPQCGTKLDASRRWRELIYREPLLARRAALQADSIPVLSAPPRPNRLPKLSQVHVPLVCQGKTKRKGKCQGGKVSPKWPAVPILYRDSETDVLTSYLRSQRISDVRPNGASKVKLITLDLPRPLPLQPAPIKVRRPKYP